MPCNKCGSYNLIKIDDADVYDNNNQEVDCYMCLDCLAKEFPPTKLDDRMYQ